MLVLALLALGTGCTTLTYVPQAAAGQADLNRRALPIDELVAEKHVNARLRRLLSEVAVLKRYGEAHGLKATSNYRRYVRIDGPAVVWVVSASEPLRFRSKTWGFPLVGSFTYLGWFHRDQANAFAEGLRREGWDVDVRGSIAYSTEGYFEDPVVSTMIPPGKEALGQLANTIFHESTHATIFVRHQSTLNESIAKFVGDALAERWLDETIGHDAEEARAYFAYEALSEQRGQALHDAFDTLSALYASPLPDAAKLAEKKAILARLVGELGFRRPINNATLLQYQTYNSGQAELRALFAACAFDVPRLVRSLKTLETKTFARDQEPDIGKLVQPLVDARCPG